MQSSLEAEFKAKQEAIRQKKKLENDISELEISLDHANKAHAEALKVVKKLSLNIDELHTQIENEQRQRDEAREQACAAEHRASQLAGDIEELRTMIEQCDKSRKLSEMELHDAADRIGQLNLNQTSLVAQKRKLEGDVVALQADLDETVSEYKNSEEKIKKAADDASRLAEELRIEQVNITKSMIGLLVNFYETYLISKEHSGNLNKHLKNFEQQVKDLQTRLDEAETSALKGGKRIIQKMEQRVII